MKYFYFILVKINLMLIIMVKLTTSSITWK